MNELAKDAVKDSVGFVSKALSGLLLSSPKIGPWLREKIKAGIVSEKEFARFGMDIEKALESIPLNRRCSLNSRIAVQAIDSAMPLLIDEDAEPELRKLFAKLIASSCDMDKAPFVHPSFPSVISQLSTLDAKNLMLFKKQNSIPIVNYFYTFEGIGSRVYLSNVFLSNPENKSITLQAISVKCLEYLGLVDIEYTHSLFDNTAYEIFDKIEEFTKINRVFLNPIYHELRAYYKEQYKKRLTSTDLLVEIMLPMDKLITIAIGTGNLVDCQTIANFIVTGVIGLGIEKGRVLLTEYGENFLNCCCD